jgi:hypothetical protein
LVGNDIPEFEKDPRLRGLRELFHAAKQSENKIMLSPQLQNVVDRTKSASSNVPQKVSLENKQHVPATSTQASVAPEPAKASRPVKAAPEPAKAPPGTVLATDLMVILNMKVSPEAKNKMISGLVEAALDQH